MLLQCHPITLGESSVKKILHQAAAAAQTKMAGAIILSPLSPYTARTNQATPYNYLVPIRDARGNMPALRTPRAQAWRG